MRKTAKNGYKSTKFKREKTRKVLYYVELKHDMCTNA